MRKHCNKVTIIACICIASFLLIINFNNTVAHSNRNDSNSLPQTANTRKKQIDNIKMQGFLGWLFGNNSNTPTPTTIPSRNIVYTSTPIPAVSSRFYSDDIRVSVGQTLTIGYQNGIQVQFYTSPIGFIKVTKRQGSNTLTIKGLSEGSADILMKDVNGNIIDICKVSVRKTSPSSLFDNHTIEIGVDKQLTLTYKNNEQVNFFTSPSGVIQVSKVKNQNKLTITGKTIGDAEILMKDNSGKVIDSCHVTVRMTRLGDLVSPYYSTPKPVKTQTPTITWHCQDATSIDWNWDNDNLCISSKGERRYVSDYEAMQLDHSYSPPR